MSLRSVSNLANTAAAVFINTMAGVADRDSALHHAAAAHKSRFESYLGPLLREAGMDDRSAGDLRLPFDGAVVTAVRDGKPGAAY
ncbi:MAG: hypothetical protein ABI650_00925 [Dokdonella sp.]